MILFLGRLDEKKGLHVLVDALAQCVGAWGRTSWSWAEARPRTRPRSMHRSRAWTE